VRMVGPGMAIGELSLGEGEPHRYTVTATEHAHVLNVTPEDVVDGLLDFPEFGVAMVRMLARRVHELNGRALELESLVARLHGALAAAGIEPPDPRAPAPAEPDPAGATPRAPAAPGRR